MAQQELPKVSTERPDVQEYIKQFTIPPQYANDFAEIMFTKEEIDIANARLAKQISADYAEIVDKTKPLVVIGLLKGCFMFYADVSRQLSVPTRLAFIQASSYGNSSVSSGQLNVSLDVKDEIVKDSHVLVLEDMIDTGNTLNRILDHLKAKGAASVKLAVLLNKEGRRTTDVEVAYNGYYCEDKFAVGYGLDFAEACRTLPFVACLKPECYM